MFEGKKPHPHQSSIANKPESKKIGFWLPKPGNVQAQLKSQGINLKTSPDHESSLETKGNSFPNITFKGSHPSKIKINSKKLLYFLISGNNASNGNKFGVNLENGNKNLSFTTRHWPSVERGWTLKTNVKSNEVGTYDFRFKINGYYTKSKLSLTFYDPNAKVQNESITTSKKTLNELTSVAAKPLNLTKKQEAQFKATVLAETSHGLSGLKDISWIYFSRITDKGWTKAMNGSAALKNKDPNFRLWMYYQGFGDEYKDYNYMGAGKLSKYVKSNGWFTGKIEPRGKAYMAFMDKTVLSDNPKNKYQNWHGQGFWGDINRNPSDGKGDQWYMARQYYLLQVEGKVSERLVVMLEELNGDGQIKDQTSFIFNVKAIEKYFNDNPNQLPKPEKVKKYTYGEGKKFKR
ncbi:MAG: hypothetical protein Crog4KO_21230 [Crocinitomicaceae bacterium]